MLTASRGQANLTAPAHGDRVSVGTGQPTETADHAAATAAYSVLPAP